MYLEDILSKICPFIKQFLPSLLTVVSSYHRSHAALVHSLSSIFPSCWIRVIINTMALLRVERLFLTPVCKMKRQDSANRAKVQRSSHTHFFLNRFVLEMRHVQITEPQSGRASEEKKLSLILDLGVWTPLLSLAVWHKSTLKWQG